MDLATLKGQIAAARKLEHAIEGATFQLRLPSDHAWRIAVEGSRDAAGNFLHAKAVREVLNTSLTGWTGVTAQHFLPEAPASEIPFSPAARAELLDCRQDIADELGAFLGEKLMARKVQLEAARKN